MWQHKKNTILLYISLYLLSWKELCLGAHKLLVVESSSRKLLRLNIIYIYLKFATLWPSPNVFSIFYRDNREHSRKMAFWEQQKSLNFYANLNHLDDLLKIAGLTGRLSISVWNVYVLNWLLVWSWLSSVRFDCLKMSTVFDDIFQLVQRVVIILQTEEKHVIICFKFTFKISLGLTG